MKADAAPIRIQGKGHLYSTMSLTEGTLMITSIGLSRFSLRPRSALESSPEHERANLSLQSLLSDIFSGTSCERFEEGYSQLMLPILGSISVVS